MPSPSITFRFLLLLARPCSLRTLHFARRASADKRRPVAQTRARAPPRRDVTARRPPEAQTRLRRHRRLGLTSPLSAGALSFPLFLSFCDRGSTAKISGDMPHISCSRIETVHSEIHVPKRNYSKELQQHCHIGALLPAGYLIKRWQRGTSCRMSRFGGFFTISPQFSTPALRAFSCLMLIALLRFGGEKPYTVYLSQCDSPAPCALSLRYITAACIDANDGVQRSGDVGGVVARGGERSSRKLRCQPAHGSVRG